MTKQQKGKQITLRHMKWEELPMASRARLMAAAVRNGYTDIRSIKEAYANYLNLKQPASNKYAKGGDTDEPEVVNLLDKLPIWKALEKIDYTAIPDPEFTREKTGAGSIEYFSAEEPEGITYNNNYHRDHPMPGHDVILYDPNTNDEQDIRLDALHIMPKDPTYDALNSLYRAESLDALDDNYYNAWIDWRADRGAQTLNNTIERALYGPKANEYVEVDPFEQYFNNEADGLLRNMFVEGTPEYIESKRYHQNKDELQQWNAHLMPYINRIEQYLKTGERPADILPELIVTNQNAYGGNLFGKGSQMNQAKQQSVGGLRGFFNLLDKYKIPYITTSEFRPGAVTKSGNASRHSRKDKWGYSMAVDAVPKDGNFENFMQTIYSYPEIVDYMRTHEIGALEEFTPEVKRKTGARGKNGGNHVHFSSGDGVDSGESWAIQMRDNRLKHLNLDTYHPMQDVTWADVQARKQLFELTPEEETLLNTSALGTYNPEYVDRSALADAVALDESLDTPANNWAKWNAFLSMQSSQSDPISSYSAIRQKEEPSLYQLFAPQGDDYLYHGLNFAAYGGKVNKFDGITGNSTLENKGINDTDLITKYGSLGGPLIRAANNLFYPGGDMLLKDNAVNPLMQYVYGPDYENVVREIRSYRPSNNITARRRPVYNIKQETDAVNRTVKATQRKIREKQVDTPSRRQQEQQKADAIQRQYLSERQGSIGPAPDRMRHPDYDPVKADQVQALREKETKENQDAYFRRVAEKQILGGVTEAIPWPSTIAGSLFNPNTHWYDPGSFFTNLYANDNRGFFNYNQATRDFYDENPEVGAVANLIGDFVVPGAAAKVLKGVGKVSKFAAADIGDAWKTMRYELAHPESQTYGIISNPFENLRNNPLFSKDARRAIRNKSERAIDNIANRMSNLDILVNTPFGEINTTVHLPYSYYDNAKYPHGIDLNLGSDQTVFTHAIPMEGNFFMHQSSPNFFSPIEGKYLVNGKPGVTYKDLTVQNKFGKVEDMIEVPVVPATGEYPTPRSFNSGYTNSRIAISREGQVIPSPINFTADLGDVRAVGVEDAVGLPEGHPIREAARKYVEDLEKRIVDKNGKPLATVEGSYRAVMNGLPHSPGDVELLMPASNMDKLEQIFNVKGKRPLMSKTGYKVRADEFDALKEGSADFEVLQNGPNGGAIGKTSWLIYEKLHPNEAKALREQYSDAINSAGPRSYSAEPDWEVVELPISAEQLFDEYVTSGFYKLKYLRDTLVSGKEKHLTRMPSLELGEGVDPNEMLRTIKDIIHKEFPGSRTLKDLGYNLDYTNVEANKEFLRHFGIPEKYAENPTQMEMIVEQMIHAWTTIDRGSNMNIPFRGDMSFVNLPLKQRKQLLVTPTNANKSYNFSGPGGNSTNQFGKTSGNTGMSREMHIVKQLPLDYIEDMNGFLTDPEVMMAYTSKYKNPSDLVKRMNEIKDASINTEYEFQAVNSFDPKDIQATRDLARKYNLSFWTKDEPYGRSGNYVGILSPNDFAHDMRYVGDQPGGFEILKPLKFKLLGENSWPMEAASAQRLQQNVFDEIMKNTDVTTALARQNKFRKAIKTMDNIDKTKDILKAVGQGTAIGVPAAGAIVGAGYYVSSIKDKRDPQKVQNAIDHTNSVLKALSTLDLAVTDAAVKSYALNNLGMALEEYNKLSFEEKADIRYKAIVECNKNLRKFKNMLIDIAEHEKKAEERYSKTKEKRKKLKRMIGKSE